MTDDRTALALLAAVLGLVLAAGFAVYWNGRDALLVGGMLCLVVGVVWGAPRWFGK